MLLHTKVTRYLELLVSRGRPLGDPAWLSQLEAMLAQEMPYIVPYSQDIKECPQEAKCEKMAELIETTGNTF